MTDPRPSGRVIAVASGKGGVGKTCVAVTLAHALADLGQRVLLVDCDFGLANVDVQLGLHPAGDLALVARGAAPFAAVLLRCGPAGFDVLPGASGSGSLAADATVPDTVIGLLPAFAAGWDTILLDLSSGLDSGTRRLAAAADTLLVIATDEPTSLTDAYAVLKLHDRDHPGGDARVVVNAAADAAAGARTHAILGRACTTFLRRDVPLAGVVRRDTHVRDAIRRQTPLRSRHPNCAAAQDVEALARALLAPA